MFDVVEWLFEAAPDGWFAQLGFARKDKRAILWLPGRKKISQERSDRAVAQASLVGCTQLAYPAPFFPVHAPENSECLICWVGLDIDGDDNAMNLDQLVGVVHEECPNASLRLSCGGEGLHVLYRLVDPVRCHPEQANQLVRRITRGAVERIEARGIRVCKADRRMFWLWGGQNEWIRQTDNKIEAHIALAMGSAPIAPEPVPEGYIPAVSQWIAKFQRAGILVGPVKPHNLIYVGAAVKALKEWGYRIQTKSGCSGNGQKNGYIDISKDRISLWTYADGHPIWSYTDVDKFLEEFLGEG